MLEERLSTATEQNERLQHRVDAYRVNVEDLKETVKAKATVIEVLETQDKAQLKQIAELMSELQFQQFTVRF